jgi:predicted oxidoreductase
VSDGSTAGRPVPTDGNLVDLSLRRIGADGPRVGPLGLGLWRFVNDDPARASSLLDAAVDAGLVLLDAADVYGADWGGRGVGSVEQLLGAALDRRPSLRERVVVATKGGIRPGVPYDSSRAAIRSAVDSSRRRLRCDTLDVWMVHRPDLFTHPAEVAEALAGVVADGWVSAVGVSNHTPAQTAALARHLDGLGISLAVTQPEVSVADLTAIRDGTLDLAARDDRTVLAWSPLAGGRLVTGEGVRPQLVEVLDDLAGREGVDRAAIALAFVLALPSRPVALVGTQRPERISALAGDLPKVRLDRADCYRLVEASEGVPLP